MSLEMRNWRKNGGLKFVNGNSRASRNIMKRLILILITSVLFGWIGKGLLPPVQEESDPESPIITDPISLLGRGLSASSWATQDPFTTAEQMLSGLATASHAERSIPTDPHRNEANHPVREPTS